MLLAVASPALKSYRRLMSIAAFKRGFILQQNCPQIRVITSLEAASDAGFMQLRELENLFPLLLNDFEDIIREFYADEGIESDTAPFYIPDELSYPSKQPDANDWLTPTTLAQKFYIKFLEKHGKSFIIAFDNTSANLDKLAEAIDPLLDPTEPKFKEMINQICASSVSHTLLQMK